jgi:hypothetical protein
VRGEDPVHDALAASALEFVAGREGVRAVDRHGLMPGDPIDGHVPDVTAVSYGVQVIAEAITEEQLSEPTTLARLRAFWPVAGDDGERSALHVFVPKGAQDQLRDRVAAAGLDPDDEKFVIHTVGLPGR